VQELKNNVQFGSSLHNKTSHFFAFFSFFPLFVTNLVFLLKNPPFFPHLQLTAVAVKNRIKCACIQGPEWYISKNFLILSA